MSANLRKIGMTASAIAVLMLAPSALVAFAASPHFIGTPTITKNADLSLTADFKAAGLGNIVSEAFLSSSGGTAELQCVNPGGNNPPAWQFEFDSLAGQTTIIPPRNGHITATVTLGPPPLPSADEVCPNPNWSVAILSLTYENVVLHIQQDGQDILTFDFGDVDP
jgi:hypothetical protein